MDLVTVILFLILYYLRPQEWSEMFATIHFVQIIMLTGVATLFFRGRSLHPRDLFRTPHDWAVLAFWLWIVCTSPTPWETFKESANLYVFYIVIVQTLHTVPRMKIFLGWWALLIVAIALLALASQWGFDPFDSLDKTNGPMKGRLILNLSIFNNPNGLGHSVVPAIPMLYYYLIWKRPMVMRVLGVGLLAIPLSCIFFTVSKGAFLCAGVTIVATMCFGRPKAMQGLIIAAALLFGTGVLYSLPRMNELNKSKSDEAIQGRVAAFKHGLEILQGSWRGIGKGNWRRDAFMTDYVKVARSARAGESTSREHYELKMIHYNKAPHSSYVCTGAELGKPGLFLFVLTLYCCLRTTVTARTETVDEERIRRMLFVLVVSYIISSWMVDFEYRPTFFMFTAAIAALHRHLMGMLVEESEPAKDPEAEPELEPQAPIWRTPHLLPQPAFAVAFPDAHLSRHLLPSSSEPANAAAPAPSRVFRIARNWKRLGWFDGAMALILTYGVIRFWSYILHTM